MHRPALTLQVRLQVALRHLLQARVAMRRAPRVRAGVELQRAVLAGTMVHFAHEVDRDLAVLLPRDRKAHRVAQALLRQARTALGVSKIAKFPQFVVAGLDAFAAGRGATALPAVA